MTTWLGRRYGVDTNFIPLGRSPERMELVRLHEAGAIRLFRTDVLGTELLAASDVRRKQLESEAEMFPEFFGPWVAGHSRLDHSVLGSPEDGVLLARVFDVTRPRVSLTAASAHDLRDAMHVAWCVRYSLDALITEDGNLLGRAHAIGERFNGFSITTPTAELAVIRRLRARADHRLRIRLSSPAIGHSRHVGGGG